MIVTVLWGPEVEFPLPPRACNQEVFSAWTVLVHCFSKAAGECWVLETPVASVRLQESIGVVHANGFSNAGEKN